MRSRVSYLVLISLIQYPQHKHSQLTWAVGISDCVSGEAVDTARPSEDRCKGMDSVEWA